MHGLLNKSALLLVYVYCKCQIATYTVGIAVELNWYCIWGKMPILLKSEAEDAHGIVSIKGYENQVLHDGSS